MMSVWTFLTLCLVVALLLAGLFYYYVYNPMKYFERIGVPGPKPSLLTGSLSLFNKYKGQYTLFHEDLVKTYGDIVGFYVFQHPTLLVCDPDMVKAFTVKEFDKFVDRFKNGGLLPVRANGREYTGLVFGSGDEWRSARHTVSPAFSTRKMKLMEPLIKKSTVKLVEKMAEFADTGNSVDVLDLYSKMTMEAILATAFGRTVDVQEGKGGKLYENAKSMFRGLDSGAGLVISTIVMLSRFAPQIKSLLRKIIQYTSVATAQAYLVDVVQKIVAEREKNKSASTHVDLIQLLIEACNSEKKNVDSGMVAAQSVEALLAGYETTSNALAFISYLLALNPEIQDKLADEIHNHLAENPDQSLYDASNELEYLDMVFQECLRLYPPVPVLPRVCQMDCVIGGLPLKAGMSVVCPTYVYHRRPEIWTDPEKFDPERFSPKAKANRHPYAHIPFGAGPRSCIGMRLAILEAKMALIEVLNVYRLVRGPDTEVPLECRVGLTMSAKNGVYLRLERRTWK